MTGEICSTCGQSHPGLVHERPARPVSKIHWYVAMVQPLMDERVAADLAKQGFEVYVATTFIRQRTPNRAWIEPDLLLPGYVFVGLDEAKPRNSHGDSLSLKAVADTLGVAGVVRLSADKKPSEVPAETILGLRLDELADRDAAKRRVRCKESAFKAGDEIEIRLDKPFGGLRGKVKNARNGGVLIEINGLPIRLNENDVIPAAWSNRRTA